MIKTSEKIYSFEDDCHYHLDSENRYELVDGQLLLMNPPDEDVFNWRFSYQK